MTPRDAAATLHAAQEDLHAQLRQFLEQSLRPSDIHVAPQGMTFRCLMDAHAQVLRQGEVSLQVVLLLATIAFVGFHRAGQIPGELAIAGALLALIGIPFVPVVLGRIALQERSTLERRYARRRNAEIRRLSAPARSLSFDAVQELKRLMLAFQTQPRSVAEFRHTALGILRNPSFPRHLAFADLALGWMKRLSDAAILERWPNLTPPDVVVYEPGDRPDTPPNGGSV